MPPAEAVVSPVADGFDFDVPDGFFTDVSARLSGVTAEEVSNAVIEVCTARGILHPELDDEPDSEMRADELREVFQLVELSALAVSDGTVVPARRVDHEFDEAILDLWSKFTDDAADEAVSERVRALSSDSRGRCGARLDQLPRGGLRG
jgi:hypothetical protein